MHGCVRALVSSVQYCHFSLGYFFLFLCTVICFLDLLLFIPSLSPFLLSSFLPLKKNSVSFILSLPISAFTSSLLHSPPTFSFPTLLRLLEDLPSFSSCVPTALHTLPLGFSLLCAGRGVGKFGQHSLCLSQLHSFQHLA